ncbi:MAG: hypothetical protein JWO80_910, partial [Bryobacterales bacterium]|nr:hypothetical protein [Bryobacterales bacterium]
MSIPLFLTLAIRIPAQPLNPKPVKELGAPRLTATQSNPLAFDSTNPNYVEGKELYNPTAVALDNSTKPPAVYVADTSNNRVLGWKYASQLASGAPADIVLGQKDLFTTLAQGPAGLTIGLSAPSGIAVDAAGNVYVADSGNNRILRYPQPFAQASVLKSPDLVLGQSGFAANTANPSGVLATSLSLGGSTGFPTLVGMAFDGAGNLWVSDPGNNRVLRYNVSVLSGAPQNGAAADLVLGQSTFTTNAAVGAQTAKNGLNAPAGLAFDSTGRLYVVDALKRVLVYTAPSTLGPAARILGVAPTSSGNPPPSDPNAPTSTPLPAGAYIFASAKGITISNGHPIVIDNGGSRALVFDLFENWTAETVSNISPAAASVIGQNTFAQGASNNGLPGASQSTLSFPYAAVSSANELFIGDTNNHRVVVFPLSSGVPGPSAIRVLGQLALNLNTANLVEGREFSLTSGSATGSIVVDRNSSPPHLYVADTANNRILGFYDLLHVKTGDIADLVIGQQNMLSSTTNYPSSDPKKPGQNTLNQPTALTLDAAGNLLVADTGNGRVLRFPQPFAQSSRSQQSADLVIGQAGFNVKVTDPTNRTMSAPTGLAVTSNGSLLVSDSALNRVLFFPGPLASGMVANKVIGQSDFNSVAPLPAVGVPQTNLGRLNSPRQIAVDPQDRVYVCDLNNGRVAIFDTVGSLPSTLPQPAFSLTSNLAQPIGIVVAPAASPAAGQMWVADFSQNGALHFPAFNQLIQSNAPDLGVAAFHPLSVALDSFGGLVLADSTNRVLQFVPQLTITNGANFVPGPVAPGTIISVFPAQSATPAMLAAAGTSASFNTLPNPIPLPTTLGDVQVTVNNELAPLFFVSPGQINLPLPATGMPTSGTVDLLVSAPKTGQIYGLTEVNMASVSPGLFTLAATGTGPAAALNADGTVNSPAHPLVRGNIIVLFGTGEGPVPNAPADGMPAPGPVPTAISPLVVFGQGDNIIQGDPSDVRYSGLAPGLIGVWQVNVRVPATVTAGNQVPVIVYLQSVPTNPG